MQDDIILGGKKRNSFNWRIFGIVMAAVAVASLIFAVVMLVVKNNEVATVKAECAAASGDEIPTCDDGTAVMNPILVAEAPEVYTINVSSATFDTGGNLAYLNLKLRDGAISECEVMTRNGSDYSASSCQISGVVGKIYKAVQLNNTSIEGFRGGLGLIMTDGTVKYVPLAGNSGNNFAVAGTLHIDGFVIDAIGAEVKANEYLEGSDWSVLFVLRSGKVLGLDAAMLEGM